MAPMRPYGPAGKPYPSRTINRLVSLEAARGNELSFKVCNTTGNERKWEEGKDLPFLFSLSRRWTFRRGPKGRDNSLLPSRLEMRLADLHLFAVSRPQTRQRQAVQRLKRRRTRSVERKMSSLAMECLETASLRAYLKYLPAFARLLRRFGCFHLCTSHHLRRNPSPLERAPQTSWRRRR